MAHAPPTIPAHLAELEAACVAAVFLGVVLDVAGARCVRRREGFLRVAGYSYTYTRCTHAKQGVTPNDPARPPKACNRMAERIERSERRRVVGASDSGQEPNCPHPYVLPQ
jgi:hypothetical protein